MRRWLFIFIGVTLFLGTATALGYRIGVGMLQNRILGALGPGSSIAALKVNWFSVEVFGLSLKAPNGWPAARTVEAERVQLFPSLLSLFTNKIHVTTIVMDKPYFSVVRAPGKLIMVPNLTESKAGNKDVKASDNASSRRGVTIDKIEFKDGVLELFDSTVSRPPLKTRFERIEGEVRNITSPAAETKTEFDLAGIVKGTKRDGRAQAVGWFELAHKDSSSQVELNAVDLVSLQPYLVKRGDAQVSKGTMDLKLNSEVRNDRIDGKGKIILRDLGFSSRGFFDTFMGIPRSAILTFLEDHNNAIDLDFTLQGDAGHPNFSLNETLATRIASAMAGQLGVNIKGVAGGVGTLTRKGVESAKGVAEGVSSAIRDLFGAPKR